MIRILNERICISLSDCLFMLDRFSCLEKLPPTEDKKEYVRIGLNDGSWIKTAEDFGKVQKDVLEGYETLEEIIEERDKRFRKETRVLNG